MQFCPVKEPKCLENGQLLDVISNSAKCLVLTQVLIVQFYCVLKSFDNLLVILKYFKYFLSTFARSILVSSN